MKHVSLYETDFLRIEYNLVDEMVVATWSGSLSGEEIIQGYENISVLIKKNYSHKLLDNHTNVQGIWSKLTDWLAYDWHPTAKNFGLQYHAMVYSKSAFCRFSTEKSIRLMEEGVVEGFNTVHDAQNWLLSF